MFSKPTKRLSADSLVSSSSQRDYLGALEEKIKQVREQSMEAKNMIRFKLDNFWSKFRQAYKQ